MKFRTWTQEQIDLLREKYAVLTNAELKLLFPNKTEIAIIAKAKEMKLRKKDNPFRFSSLQIEELKRIYPTTRAQDLANEFGCTKILVQRKASKLGIKKDKEFIRKLSREAMMNPDHPGRKAWIKKGTPPPNKGKKMKEILSPEKYKNWLHSQFSKGNRPHNTVPVGTEVYMPQYGYTKVKIAEPNKWALKHRLIWERHNGPIPKGFNIQFKDGNPKNFDDINNLYMVDKSGNMQENSIHRYPEEIQNAMRTIGQLTKAIKKYEKTRD